MALSSLENAPLELAAAAGHHAIQLIRGQWRQPESPNGDTLATDGDTSLSPQQISLMQEIIGEIETTEDAAVRNLSEETANHYIREITDQLEALSRVELGASAEHGRYLLDELRQFS